MTMEPKHGKDFEDFISSLDRINRQIEPVSQASIPDMPDERNDKEDRDDSFPLEEYLASRLQQIGEVAPETKQANGLRSGNGWDANQVVESAFKIEPIPVKRAVEIALSSNKKFRERLRGLLQRRREIAKVVGTPTVEFVPIWKLKGYHECYYLRTGNYKVNVRDDVVGVEVEGRSRDLMLEKRHRHFIPAAIVERFQMLGAFLTSESKYFVVTDVLELAKKRSTSELTITGLGKIISQDEEMALTSWKSKRIFDQSELTARGATVAVRESILTKEGVLSKFREQVVRMPERFKQILSNRLQITELKRLYVPLIKVPVQRGLVPHDVVINGASGELADSKLLELLE
jgi:hypothetical protein